MVRRGFYRHYKGSIYFVLGVADGVDHKGEPLVIYESLQGTEEGKLQVRTLADFEGDVEIRVPVATDGFDYDTAFTDGTRAMPVPRFRRVDHWETK
jgi:hypothetical protein